MTLHTHLITKNPGGWYDSFQAVYTSKGIYLLCQRLGAQS